MPPALYGGGRRGWRRPDKCDCGKIPYRDEAAARAAADRRGKEVGVELTVYQCPGSSRWHKTGRGFHPRALKTRPRIIAWQLSARRVMSRDGLYRELGVNPAAGEDRTVKSAIGKVLRAFADLGLVCLDDPHRGYVTAIDFDGLRRVMQVGLQEYAEARGMSVTRPPRAARPATPATDEPASPEVLEEDETPA